MMQNAQPVWAMPSITFIGLFIINFIPTSSITGDGFGMDGKTAFLRFWMFFGFLCLFVPLVAGIWYGIEGFMQNKAYSSALGWGMIAQTIIMIVAGMFFKTGRTEEAWSSW